MTQYNISNVNLSNSLMNKLKSGTKNVTDITLNYKNVLILLRSREVLIQVD